MEKTDKEVTRARQKVRAAYQAQLRLKQRMEAIDFNLDVVAPALDDLADELAHGRLVTIEADKVLALPPAKKAR